MSTASFYNCNPEDEVNNNLALGESHALAVLYKSKDEAAVICQTIAACKPQESGYAVICDVSLSYAQHFGNQQMKRRWSAVKAEVLESYKHDLASLAIKNIEKIKKIYKECIKGYKFKSVSEREKAAIKFRKEMQANFGDVRQNAWTHETVYQALIDRGGREKQSQLNRYVTLYDQEKNCALLYAPNSKGFARKPFHTNDSRPHWKPEVFVRLKSAIEKVSEDKHKGTQNFVQYAVLDWTQFAEAVGLIGGNVGSQIEADPPDSQASSRGTAKLSDKQLRILKVLSLNGGWLTRKEMEEQAGKKGFSNAMGAPTRGECKPGTLEFLGYVKRRDLKRPLEYLITDDGKRALVEYDHEHGEVQLLSPAEIALAEVTEELDEQVAFDPTGIEDARKRDFRAIVLRQGQPKFRKKLLKAYDGRCAITGCTAESVLEAAHIVPYKGEKTHHASNGLLLRADFHTLFDRQLVSIDEGTMKLLVSSTLNGTDYENYRDKEVRIPKEKSCQLNREALKQHRMESGLG